MFYWAKLYSSQLKEREEYSKLNSACSLIFANFILLKEERLLKKGQRGQRKGKGAKKQQAGDFFHSFSIRSDQAPHFKWTDDLKIMTVEFGRFLKKDLNDLVDLRELWCYFIKESHNLSFDDLRHLSSKGEDMKIAADHLIELSRDKSLRALEEDRQKAERDRKAREAYQFDEGIKKGREEGIEKGIMKGIEKGREEGIEKGKEEGREQLVLNMLGKKLDMDLISELSGWTEERILKLKNKA